MRIKLKVMPYSVVNGNGTIWYLSAKLDGCYFPQELCINCYWVVGMLQTVIDRINGLQVDYLFDRRRLIFHKGNISAYDFMCRTQE